MVALVVPLAVMRARERTVTLIARESFDSSSGVRGGRRAGDHRASAVCEVLEILHSLRGRRDIGIRGRGWWRIWRGGGGTVRRRVVSERLDLPTEAPAGRWCDGAMTLIAMATRRSAHTYIRERELSKYGAGSLAFPLRT